MEFPDSLGFEKVVRAHFEVKRSWRHCSTVVLFGGLITTIMLSVERIIHRDCLGEDRASPERLGLERFPSASAFLRFLERYSYQVTATNVADMAPEEVWEFYNGRAVVENRIE